MSSNPYSIPNPKVDPSRKPAMRPDNTPDDNDRIEIGPTPLAYAEWEATGLQCPDLPALRQYRLDRIVAGLIARDLDAVLLFDPPVDPLCHRYHPYAVVECTQPVSGLHGD